MASKKGADAVVGSIEVAGGKAVAVQADMSKSADVIRLFDTVKADRGKPDVLVNNAGVAVFEMVGNLHSSQEKAKNLSKQIDVVFSIDRSIALQAQATFF